MCVGLGVGLTVAHPSEGIKLLVKGVPTLIGAFVGAWFAFKFQLQREETKDLQERFEAINHALFLLGRFLNELEVIKRQAIDPVRG